MIDFFRFLLLDYEFTSFNVNVHTLIMSIFFFLYL